MRKLPLLGDEAIAQGAIDAGLSGIYAYPGTPSTEITEFVQRSKEAKAKNIRSSWSTNEKTAMEAALGMSYAGKRAMVCMKHVGLNVAADAFINSAITGVNGGLIVVAADDPSMHSSQNEQDSRFFGKFAMIPVLEPSNQQEAYDMVHYGFEISEKYRYPVLMRITTRLAHSRADVAIENRNQQNEIQIPENLKQFVLLPAFARKNYNRLIEIQSSFQYESLNSGFNTYFEGTNKNLGIIVSGIAYNYLLENIGSAKSDYPILKITQYPLPSELIKKIYDDCKSLLVIEEGYPFIEESISGILSNGKQIKGRLDGTLPRVGELEPSLVAKALNLEIPVGFAIPEIVVSRPPSLCGGCPHIDSFNALNEALQDFTPGRVFSDIGCYALGALPPFDLINSCVDMGASVTMAKGASDAGLVPSVAVIGDSTFTHSGITGLIDAVQDKTPITVIILDNLTTAMTGGQLSQATGRIEEICKGIGVEEEHIRIFTPLKKNHSENVKVIREEMNYKGVSVIIPRRECVVTITKKTKEARAAKSKTEDKE